MTLLDERVEVFTSRLRGSIVRWWLLCAVVVIALRTPFINVPLGIDEGGDSFVARAWGTTDGSMYGGSWLDRPPLLVLIYKIGVLGGDLGVRLLGMVAAILLVAATMAIAHRIAGLRAARITGVITAVMTSSVVLGAVFTDNELLATVPATFSILALMRARDAVVPDRWLFVSGFLATCALLIKQSFGEVLVAGAVFLLVSWVTRARSGFQARWLGWWLGGVAAPILVTFAWFEAYSVGARGFVYAVAGFRLDSITEINAAPQGAGFMLLHLGLPVLVVSGCLFLVPWSIAWLVRRRADPQLVLPLAAWLLVGFVGIAGGGNYYPHYFIQPVAALAVLSGCALAVTGRRMLSIATTCLVFVLAIGNVAVGTTLQNVNPPQQRTLAVADYLRSNARPDDTLYVLYARANLLYYADMTTPYPYSWTQMVRTVPNAEDRLRDLLKSSTRRPTWIVEWQEATIFGMDATGETRRLIARHYVRTDEICGKPILIRRDEADRTLIASTHGECATLGLPKHLGPSESRTPEDSADYVWQ
ncbi:ArnT family glycosyltransferase [Aeromicrobium stalagmiti]|uniref:ArnT family glycosyltransferase n=1 Tax=Aeromicrobium stalagmiti TaxID=2738988 RepID=UPI00156938E4|nr:glycosyltransferase family 39 protein [Aeromicrobium stalagmiti]